MAQDRLSRRPRGVAVLLVVIHHAIVTSKNATRVRWRIYSLKAITHSNSFTSDQLLGADLMGKLLT